MDEKEKCCGELVLLVDIYMGSAGVNYLYNSAVRPMIRPVPGMHFNKKGR